MHNFEIKDGKLTAESNARLRPIFTQTDGEYCISVYQKGSAGYFINEIIEWYHSLPADYCDIEKMQWQLKELTYQNWRFTRDIGLSSAQKISSRFKVKIAHGKTKRDLIESGKGVQEAANLATVNNEVLYEQEAAAEANDDIIQAEQKAINSIINGMSQHLATMKQERGLLMRSDSHNLPQQR